MSVGMQGRRRQISAPVERLTKESQVFSELQASRYRFMAYFGEEASRPSEEITAIHGEIVRWAGLLIRTVADTAGRSK
jgi:hypothetical protein